ncbi:MAG TPA: amino acid adenylation domain-containing protein [Nostocaceae cyanobacterium]|nr:amino acid adenylation domain-containing protein [Nostocaceae cyanobacterium]
MEVYVLPLSIAQRQLWYQELIAPGNIAYNIPIALHLVGKLNFPALESAFQQIIQRHEILRTTFAVEDGEPVQLVYEQREFRIERKVINPSLAANRQEVIQQITQDSQHQFNLVQEPLMRVILYQITETEQILLVNQHHIISDGWSLGILVKELTHLYTALVQNREIDLPELPIQYGDYAIWQEEWLKSTTIQPALNYWQQTLAAPLPILDLPLDKPRPPQQSFHGSVIRETLPKSLTAGITELAKSTGVTFFMVTLAVYQVLLYRYSGQTDIIVGSPVANRQNSEINDLIGYFVNTVVLRGNLSGKTSFREFLQRIAQTCIDAYARQEIPLELLVEKLGIKRDPSRPPIFQTLFAVQNAPVGEIQLPQLTVKPIYIDNGGAKFDLSLMLEPTEDGWIVALEYNTDLFTSDTAQRLLTHYQQLLQAVVNSPDAEIDTLPLLTTQEREELLNLAAASVSEVKGKNIVELFTQAAESYRERIAVSAAGKTLTYQELDQHSHDLAELLQQKGVKAEVKVGIFLERSEKLIIAILAVLKAGGTYVPLDPQYPKERLEFIAEDSQIKIILTETNLLTDIPTSQPEIIVIDQEEIAPTVIKNLDFGAQILPTQAAYIIYTSGSTGKPKGCVVAHQNVTRLMENTQAWYEFNQNDVWTLFHSFAFDFSVWEIWGALLYGGKLVVVPYLESRSPEAFRYLLQQERVTILNQTPSAFRQLIRADQEFNDKLNLRAVIFGGEALELQSLKPWVERYGDDSPQLINMYGITETTVHVTYRRILAEDIEQNRGSVIGAGIPDLSLYILDDALEPAPIGVSGEIYVGGKGLSRGYLHRPELTAERFIPDPFSNRIGARLYKTGDLARRLINGDLEYLGRRDLQVKIRGFRIELGEIESALSALPQVAEAVVIVHSVNSEDKRLVAYIVPNGEQDSQKLKEALKEHLPDYMIPAAFMFLAALPLTAQGKIDRKSLPVPDWNQGIVKRDLILPQTPAEKVICVVWEQVLGIEQIGILDNFFDLGGDSILALRVVTEMRRQGLILTPKEIFQYQTVQQLAKVAKMVNAPGNIQVIAIGEVGLTPIQKWFFELNIPNRNHWNQAILLEVHPSLKPETIATAIRVVAKHHDAFRLRFEQENDIWQQFYTKINADINTELFSFATVDLSAEGEREQNAEMTRVGDGLQTNLSLNHGPLAAAVWFNLGKEHFPRLLIVIHHLIVDGVSWRVLLQDLAEVIAGNELQKVSTSFQQWSQFLQSFATSSQLTAEKVFWLNAVQGETAKLPLDFPNSESKNLESSIKKVSQKLTKAQTQVLLTKANKAYHTQPQDLLLTALAKTLNQITQSPHLQIMMEGHGREELAAELDITRTLGWFTTLYPLRLEVPTDLTIDNLIISVKEQFRAVPNRGFGYSSLRYLNSETAADLMINSPQISFNYLGQVRNESGNNKLFRLLNADIEPTRNPEGERPHLIDINAIVVDGELQIDWLYSSNLHLSPTINQWVADFCQNLEEILNHCLTSGVSSFTPSDFPLAKLNQNTLNLLQTKYPDLEDIYNLSPLQEGMLFHSIYAPEEGVYFEQVLGKIKGKLDISAFTYAWQSVIDRHPVLRTGFIWDNQEQPLQIIRKAVNFAIDKLDWSEFTPAQQEVKLQEYLAADRSKGFELDCAPLMRFTVIQLNANTWEWVWSHHHIILDGWSLPIIFKEVLTIYQTTLAKASPNLHPVPNYRNYIQWLATSNRIAAEEFWQSTLAGISTATKIDFYPTIQDSLQPAYSEAELRLSGAEFSQLQTMAQTYRLTLNTIAQGAWALCLQKYGAGDDVVFGVTVSGRPTHLPDVENMVGLFINTLPLRISVNPQNKIVAWLQEIQLHQVQMREFEYSKLTDIQKLISLPAGENLFDSILVFENYPVDKSLKEKQPDFQVDEIQFLERTNYPLTLGVIPDDGLLLKLNYQTRLLSATDATTMLARLRNVMLSLAENAEEDLRTIEFLNLSERNQLINQARGQNSSTGNSLSANQLFERQVEINPTAIAIVYGNDSITYGELEHQANQLARSLQIADIGYESIVGLYFDASIDYIIAMLAVLKVGAAFLPLDKNYPQARLKFIVEDSRTNLILCVDNPDVGLFSSHVKILPLSEITEVTATTRLYIPVQSQNLAYVIYTSGSTGKPKGVLVTHAGIENLVRCQTASFNVTPDSRVYQFASLNFDAAISEIFMALGSGATLYIQTPENRLPSPALWQTLTNWKITHVTFPPSLLAAMSPADLPTLQTLIVAGEAASGELFRKWGSDSRTCFNAYGPTESTVCATLMNCTHLIGEPSIGRAIANLQVYILDSWLEPVPPGVAGEIYIGGIGLARGYLNRPGLTASAFVPHPFAKQSGERLYKTGDRAVYDLDGNIRFLGRQDNQVKFNGHRIELGEIETALTKYPQIESAVVMVRQDIPERKRLVAYVLAPQENAPSSQKLKDYLANILPSYMLPNAIVLLTAWPLTPNGKIDRQALPTPELSATPEIAKTPTEEILGKIWAEVLGLESVSPNDNFFELGGDSIVSLQIVSRSRAAGWEISPKDIFENQTLARLATKAKPLISQTEIIEPLTGNVFLSPIQSWFFSQNWTHSHHWNQAIALNVREELDIKQLENALQTIVNHHDIFRLAFSQSGDSWKQYYTGEATKPNLRIEDFNQVPSITQELVLGEIVEQEHASFQLQKSPLLRVVYAQNLAKHGNVLFLFAHHLVVDGVSWRILVEDLQQAYRKISLPAKTASYRTWTETLTTLANDAEITQDIAYWRNILSTPTATLAVDLPHTENNTVASGATVICQLSPSETSTLLKQSTAIYHANIQEILLAALLKTLADTYQFNHWLIDLEGHGRDESLVKLNLTRTVGWFTCLYPLLLEKPAETNDKNLLLKAIKSQIRNIPHEGISFGLLRYLHEDSSVKEIFNQYSAPISFNYLGQIDHVPNHGNLFSVSNLSTGTGVFTEQQRPHLLAINARVQDEKLQIDWSYSQNIHYPQTIQRLADNYLSNLRLYLTDTTADSSSFYSTTDFQLVDLSENELDSILADLED